jgi:hypothetical protein
MRLAALPMVLAALVLPVSAEAEQAESILGEWQQIATNAGACPTCRIAFRTGGRGIVVSANNGWTATLARTGPTDLTGDGHWDPQGRGWPTGRAFTIRFRQDGDRLAMTMVVDTGTGQRPTVHATFVRSWQGV